MLLDLCDAVFLTFSNLKKVGGDDILLVYFLKNKIKIMEIFLPHYVKLIILKDLVSFFVHYILHLFHFGTLIFKSFILVIEFFQNRTIMFLTKN